MARERKEPDAPAGCPAWLATYGDMITLVLTFFILLYSMSTIDAEKFKAMVINFGGNPYLFDYMQFTANEGQTGAMPVPELDIEDIIEESEDWFQTDVVDVLQEIIDQLKDQEAGGGDQGSFELQYKAGDPYVIFRMQNEVLFDTASAELKPESLPIIKTVADLIMEQFYAGTVIKVDIEGHADERSLTAGGEFKDNEDLSYSRAKSTLMYIRDLYEDAYGLFFSVARGAAIPLVDEHNEDAWRRNRRVEFLVFKNPDFDPAADPDNPAQNDGGNPGDAQSNPDGTQGAPDDGGTENPAEPNGNDNGETGTEDTGTGPDGENNEQGE